MEVRVFSTWVTIDTEPVAEQLRAPGWRCDCSSAAIRARSIRRWERFLPRNLLKADMVHVHGMWEEVQHWSGKIARQMNKPYVFTPHGMIAPWCLKKNNFPKRLYLRVSHEEESECGQRDSLHKQCGAGFVPAVGNRGAGDCGGEWVGFRRVSGIAETGGVSAKICAGGG